MREVLQAWLSSLSGLDWLTFGAGVFVGGLIAFMIATFRLGRLTRRARGVETELAVRDSVERERELSHAAAREELSDAFSRLSGEALRYNNEQFLALAQQRLQRQSEVAQMELKEREVAIDTLIKPIREALVKTERQIQAIESERKESFGALTEHLRLVTESQHALRTETRNLVTALRRPEVRGRWGELTLRRLVELAGMAEHCDFEEQVTVGSDDVTLRPDMVVNLPDDRHIVVDVKTPLDAYLAAIEATDDDQRARYLQRHAQNVRQRVRKLAEKGYWAQFETSPDFVVLFIPGEQFLSAALNADTTLLEDALGRKVILATPTSLMAVLRAVAFSWRQLELVRNAETIRRGAEEFHDRVAVFVGHLNRLGSGLGGSVDAFNRAVGSFERSLLPSARRLRELGVGGTKTVEETRAVEANPRKLKEKDEVDE